MPQGIAKPVYTQIDNWRFCRSPGYNWDFDTNTGFFARWGNDLEDDPLYSPLGPELIDMEISTICHGPGKPCAHCYKSNTSVGINMPLDIFKKLFDRINHLSIIITGKDGKTIELNGWDKITLTDGSHICAADVKEGDEILDF